MNTEIIEILTDCNYSVANDPKEIIDLLAKRNIDINDKNPDDGETCLFVAASSYYENSGMILLLIKLGVDVNAINNNGDNALFGVNNEGSANTLIKSGIDVNH